MPLEGGGSRAAIRPSHQNKTRRATRTRHVPESTPESAPFLAGERLGGLRRGRRVSNSGAQRSKGGFSLVLQKAPTWKRVNTGARSAHLRNGKKRRTRRRETGNRAAKGAREARRARQNPVRRPREGRLPAPPHTVLFLFFRRGEKAGAGEQEVPRALPEGEGPRPEGCRSQEGVGEVGTGHKGKCGGDWVKKQEEPQCRLPPPRGKGLTRPPPPPPPPTPPRPRRRAEENRIQITYNGIVSCAGTAQSLPPRNRRRCRPGHDPLRREGGGPASALGPTPLPHPPL